MKTLITILFLAFAGVLFAQPVRTTITDDGTNVTVQTPVNIKVIPICDFHWLFSDGNLQLWVEGRNELIPGGRLGNFTVNGATTQAAKLAALGAISDQCSTGGGLDSLYLEDGTLLVSGDTIPSSSGITTGDKGDIDVVNASNDWRVDTASVTWAKLAQAVKDSIATGSGGGGITPNYFDILYSGQSNMVGVNYADHPPSPAIFWETNPRLRVQKPDGTFESADPALGNIIPASADSILNIPFLFGSRYVQEHPTDTARLVGFAAGGIPIERWTPETSGLAGETADNYCLDSLINKLNRMPTGTDVKVMVWHQGETGNGNATYLTKLFSVYDTLVRHSKVADDMIMIVGDYSEVLVAAPHIPIDSLRFGTKDLGGRRIFVASYQHLYADQLYDATTHFDANFMVTVGEGYYATWKSRRIEPLTPLTGVSLDFAYNNSGSSPTVTVDGNGGSNGLRFTYSGANGLIHNLSGTTGTAKFQGVRSGNERSSWFRADGRAIFNSSSATPETPMATANSAAVYVDMGIANESNIWLNGNNSARLILENHAGSGDAGIWGLHSRGSAATPTESQSGDRQFYISSRAWAGSGTNTTYVEGANIGFRANGNWSFANRSTNIYFSTVTSNSSTMVDRFQIGDLVTSLVGLKTNSTLYETADVTYTATSNAMASSERYVNLDATSNNVSVTLPTAEDGRILSFRRVDATANIITLTGTVNGVVNPTSATPTILALGSQNGTLTIRGNGTSWEVWNRSVTVETMDATYLRHGANMLTANTTFNGTFDWRMGNTTALDTIQLKGASLVLDGTITTVGNNTFSGNIVANGSTSVITLKGYTVATLPVAPATGSMAYVTDATAPTYLGTLTGGGAAVCPVFYNGTVWVSH